MATLSLSNGSKMPTIGLGTWKSKPDEVQNAVATAIKCGYRHIDCAYIYQNEGEVGKGIKQALDSGICERKDLFITSKLWNTHHRKDLVAKACKMQLELLGLDYLDLYLVHSPMAYQEGDDNFPKDADGKFIVSTATNSSYLDAWEGMEECVELNLARNIGLSNFNSEQIENVLRNGKIKPAVLQVEIHPFFNNRKLMEFAQERGIVVTAYSPFGAPDRPWAKAEDKCILNEEKIKEMAKKYNKTAGQVVLRWNLQLGTVVIPKSVTPSRIEENLKVYDFELTQEDMETINSFHNDENRVVHLRWLGHFPDWPFSIEF